MISAEHMPSISKSSYGSSLYALDNLNAGLGVVNTRGNGFLGVGQGGVTNNALPGAVQAFQANMAPIAPHPKQQPKEKPVTRRLVQVFIADPDDNVPLEKSLLYSGSQKLTDATDQELFFEIDIKSILDAYNKDRVTLINKKVKERTEYLEPVKIRDLKMVVVDVATF